MALAASLIPGFQYRITAGAFAEEIVTITSNTPFPDKDTNGKDHPLRRKITVMGPDGSEMYILPRLLDERPVGVEGQNTAPVIIHAPPVAPTPEALMVAMEGSTGGTLTTEQVARRVEAKPITDPMDSRLDHLRPSRAKVKRYLRREMSNGSSDIDFMLTFANDDYRSFNEGRPQSVILNGPTQSGKTIFVEALAQYWAEMMGLPKAMPIFTLSGSTGITDYDLFGQTTSYTDPTTGVEALIWLPGLVDLAAQAGGILYMDEVNAFPNGVKTSLFSLLDSRHQFVNRNKPVFRNGQFMPDVVTASLDLWIIGTMNEGYQGLGDMNEAFVNRFEHILWDYDKDVEAKLITSPAIRLLGEALRTARAAGAGIKTPIGTSALQRFERNVAAFGISMAVDILTGMFKANERGVVTSIVEDRSIFVLLQEEARQARQDA